MATSRSINPTHLLKKDARLLVYYLRQHNFEKSPYFISFTHLNQRIHLTNYLQKRMDENNQPYYLIIGEQLIKKDSDPYDTYVIAGVLTIEDNQLLMTTPENYFLLDVKEINPYHLTSQESEFLYDLFKAATSARPRKLVFLERDHFAFSQGDVRFESDLNFTTKIVGTRVNKPPIGKEHAYRWRPMGKCLGAGAFGEVYDASLKLVPEKERKLSAISTPVVMKVTRADAQHEYDMLKAVGEKPKRLTTFIDEDGWSKSILGMRRHRGRELFDVLDDEFRGQQFLTATQRMYVALNFALQVKAIHQRDILHLDLKPENAMVDEDGNIKIIDLGLSMPIAGGGKYRYGTFQYMAPEVLFKQKTSVQSDIFSLACVLRAIFNVTMTVSYLDKMEAQYKRRLNEIDTTKKDARKKKAKVLEEIVQMFAKQAKVTDTSYFMHDQVEGFTVAQREALEKLYAEMHHVNPKKRLNIDEIILRLENVLLGVLINEQPENKNVLKDLFERAGRLKKALLHFEKMPTTDDAALGMLEFFYKNADIIPEQFNTHYVRMLGVQAFEGLEIKSELLNRVKIIVEDFVRQHQLVVNFQLSALTSGNEKFKKDVQGALDRIERMSDFTIDHLVKLTEQLKKDLALLSKYYSLERDELVVARPAPM